MTINGSRWVQDQPERQQCACRNVHSEYNTWISHKNLYSLLSTDPDESLHQINLIYFEKNLMIITFLSSQP